MRRPSGCSVCEFQAPQKCGVTYTEAVLESVELPTGVTDLDTCAACQNVVQGQDMRLYIRTGLTNVDLWGEGHQKWGNKSEMERTYTDNLTHVAF